MTPPVRRVLALHRVDLAPAQQLVAQLAADQGEAPLLTVCDPVLHHHAITQGLTEVRLLPLPDARIAVDVAARAHAATRLLQADCDALLAPVIPAAVGCGWLSHWLRQFHTTAYGYARIGQLLAERLAGDTVALLMPDQPHRYGYHSCVPALKVAESLRAAGQAPRLYQTALQPPDDILVPDLRAWPAAGDEAPQLLVHLPTCFYDAALFARETQASGLRALVLPAPLFDVELPGLPRLPLCPPEALDTLLDAPQRAALEAVCTRLLPTVERAMRAVLGQEEAARSQARALVDAVRLQARCYAALLKALAGRPLPQALLLSNHDAGLHGAWLAWARERRVPVLCVPHSKVHNQRLPVSDLPGLRCLHHGLQGGVPVDLDDNPVACGVLDYAEDLDWPGRAPERLRTLGLVLNGLAANAMCLVDLRHYLHELQRLRDWARRQGVDCRIRCRPNESIASVLAAELGVPVRELLDGQAGSLVDFARGCDLVIGIDQPTSGSAELLRAGIPMLQALVRPLAPEEWRIVDAGVVPQLPVDAVLARLQDWADTPLGLWQHAQAQRRAWMDSQADARPLRHWLGAAVGR
ncbi:MAG: hypothetical protein RL223_1685 [Pseudomonadota bacterium]